MKRLYIFDCLRFTLYNPYMLNNLYQHTLVKNYWPLLAQWLMGKKRADGHGGSSWSSYLFYSVTNVDS